MTLPAAAANNNSNKNTFSNPIELPSLETTDAADRAKEQAFEALEYSSSEDGQYQYVKCQNPSCGKDKRIAGKLQRPKTANDRIGTLQKRIKWLEYRLSHDSYNYNPTSSSAAAVTREIKEAKEELARLEAEDQKWDRFRSLPLYSTKSTGYRFFCSDCWDQAVKIAEDQRKNRNA